MSMSVTGLIGKVGVGRLIPGFRCCASRQHPVRDDEGKWSALRIGASAVSWLPSFLGPSSPWGKRPGPLHSI